MTQPEDKNSTFFCDREVITLSREGIWYSDGIEITHEGTRELFFKSIRKLGDDTFLQVGRETYPIIVEDTSLFVRGIQWEGALSESTPTLALSDGTREKLNPETLRLIQCRLTCRVHQESIEAKFLRNPYLELLKEAESHPLQGFYLNISGKRISLNR